MIKKNGGIFGRNPTYNDVVVEGVLTLKEAQVFDNDITINGDLTVNGTETVINTVELNVDDKNITMGAAVAKVGLAATTNITAGQFTVQLAETSGLIPGMTVTKTSGTGAFGASPKIASVDSHTQITLDVAHATSGTIIFDTGGATDDTADGGGITLKGTTDKFIKWVKASVAWVFSDPIKAPDVTVDNLTASKPVFTDANKKLTSTGTLAIDQGGTGQTTQQAAINALAGAVTAAQFLRGDGTDVKMSAIQAADVPTLNQNTTGTASNVTGTVNVDHGGTGLTAVSAGRIPFGNSSTALNTDSTLVWDNSNKRLGVKMATPAFDLDVGGSFRNYGNFQLNNQYSGGGSAGVICCDNSHGGGAVMFFGRYSDLFGTAVDGVRMDGLNNAMNAVIPVGIRGNPLRLTGVNQITFQATQDASADPNTLDDYEEGTWTATIRGSGTAGTYEFATNNCTYTKIGNQVTVFCFVRLAGSVTGGGTGDLQITGLPFSKAANQYPVAAVYMALGAWSGNPPVVSFNSFSSNATLFLEQIASGGYGSAIPISFASANAYLAFSITYTV